MKGLRGSKKGFEFLTNWVVVLFILILFASFFVSLVVVNIWISFIIIGLFGIVLGHFIYAGTEGNRFPYYLLGFSFIIGWLLGHKTGNLIVFFLFFLGVVYASYKLHQLVG